jgi:NAD(P)-dependent dehydrogenase (short-subunit alcohol dehydrogenase family)
MTHTHSHARIAMVTGASRGFGLATARALVAGGWGLVIDARGAEALTTAAEELRRAGPVTALSGDVADPDHRRRLVEAAEALGGLDLLINNASVLGPSPQPALAEYPLDVLRRVYEVNVVAPLALVQQALPLLRERDGAIVNITSDAAEEGYPGWGGYGSSKAAFNQVSNVLAAEEEVVRVYWFDPGDMNTAMHQEAFPGEDISDRPSPEASVPALLRLLDERPGSGHHRADRVAAS